MILASTQYRPLMGFAVKMTDMEDKINNYNVLVCDLILTGLTAFSTVISRVCKISVHDMKF